MPFTVGESVGPYRIMEQLGQGGMATVFKAYHSALDRYVAIKALHSAFTLEPNFLARFRREAQVVAKLEHPNIVPVYDFAEHEGRPYLVLKFIEGITLKARLKQGMLSSPEINNIVNSIGEALEYAHHQGVLHRDVKPSNVLLAKDGRIFLADFGLARIAQAGESTISSDVMLGTPQYISPEQAMGQRELDAGTDIYSFGVLLYELLVGRVPFSADTPYSVIHDHIYAPLPLPRSRKPEIPEAVERVILKALAKDRKDRFQSVKSLVEAWNQAQRETSMPLDLATSPPAIEQVVVTPGEKSGSTPIVAQPAELPEIPASDTPGKKGKGKRKRTWAYIAGAALVCFCLLVFLGVLSENSKKAGLEKVTAKPTLKEIISLTTTASDTALPVVQKPSSTPRVTARTKVTGTLMPAITPTVDILRLARQKVFLNPSDPMANMELAIALWDHGYNLEAEKSFQRALEFAEDNLEFYRKAGEYLVGREWWLRAARVYSAAARSTRSELPDDLHERIRMTYFLASADPQAGILFKMEEAARVEKLVTTQFFDILRARQILYKEGVAAAEAAVSKLDEQNVELPELQLLKAEIHIFKQEFDAAKAILEPMVSDMELPEWVRAVAKYLLNDYIP